MLRISATSRLCPLSCSRCKVISKWQCDGDDNDYDDNDDDDDDGDDHLLQGWGGPLQLHVLLLPCLEACSTLATILVLDLYTAMFTPSPPSSHLVEVPHSLVSDLSSLLIRATSVSTFSPSLNHILVSCTPQGQLVKIWNSLLIEKNPINLPLTNITKLTSLSQQFLIAFRT